MRAPVVFIIFTALLQFNVEAARILGLFPHMGKSHQMVFEPLLRTLAKRGHRVTVISFFPLQNQPANYTDVSLEGVAPIGLETVDINFIEEFNALSWPRLLGVDRILGQIFGFHPLADMALSVCSKLVHLPAIKEAMSRDYDVVLIENFNSDCMLGLLEVYGVRAPKIALSSCNLMPWSADRVGASDNPSYVPLVSTEFTDTMSLLDRVENTVMNLVMKYWFRHFVQEKEQELIEKTFGRRVDLRELGKNMTMMLVNTHHSLNGIRPGVPGVVEVGGMHLNPVKKPIPTFMEQFLNESEEGVILFSWGSLIKTSTIPTYKEEVLVRALNKLPQRVIWKYEGSAPEGNLTGNILRVNWIPQYELLQHKKVIAFVAHGGLLGMTEAISAGKPMVVVPFFGDQPHNGAAASKIGLATVVRYKDLNEETFSQALKKVLSAEMRLSARQASMIWHDRIANPLDTAIYWTERVARWGSASVLHSSARDMPFYEKFLLDVLAVLILSMSAVLLVLRAILKMFLHILQTMFSPKAPKKKVH